MSVRVPLRPRMLLVSPLLGVVGILLILATSAFACTTFVGTLRITSGPNGALAVVGERPLGSDCPPSPPGEGGVIDLTTVPPVCGHDQLDDATYDVNFLHQPVPAKGRLHHECMADSPHTNLGVVAVQSGKASVAVKLPSDAVPSDSSTVCIVAQGWGAVGNEALVVVL